MRHTLFLFFAQKKTFWNFRARLKKLLFWIEARLFGIKYNLQEEKSNYQSFSYLLRITQSQLFLALTFAIVLQVINPHLKSFYIWAGWSVPDDGDYVTLLATISGIGGVFIGLYYAALSTVGGAIYSRVPNNIRDLLAQERLGNVYMLLLSFMTFLGLTLIALRLLGYERILLAVPFTTIVAGVGIISFVKLGQRAFYLFDPTALSYHLFDGLRHWLRMVKAGGFRWTDNSFQKHAHKQASIALGTLDTLSEITSNEKHLNGKPFIELAKNILRFLRHYEQSKRCIPPQSV